MSGPVLALDEKLDLRAAGELAKSLAAYRGAPLALDAGAVRQIGALSAQVIRAAARSWAEDGQDLSLQGVSTDLADQLELLGFNADTMTIWESAQ
ncbi:MAG TPA: STAS domain-containing protein [Rhodobacterales bacterium]|nr:STAS domain-containing protein [Rhodobacterales bacterium]